MKRINKYIYIFFLILFLFMIIFPKCTYAIEVSTDKDAVKLATGVIDPEDFTPTDLDGEDPIFVKGSTIITIIRVIGIIVTVVTLILIGIKYMTGSIEQKADYKKSMIPYLIGVFVFFGLSQIIPIIIEISKGIESY